MMVYKLDNGYTAQELPGNDWIFWNDERSELIHTEKWDGRSIERMEVLRSSDGDHTIARGVWESDAGSLREWIAAHTVQP